MKKFRFGVFETNSSSSHSLSIISEEEFNAWQNGEMVYNKEECVLQTKEEFNESYEKNKKWYHTFEEYEDDNAQSYEQWESYDDGLETFVEKHTTKSGDKIVVFGKYGYDS